MEQYIPNKKVILMPEYSDEGQSANSEAIELLTEAEISFRDVV